MDHLLELLPVAVFVLQHQPEQPGRRCTAMNPLACQLLGLEVGVQESSLVASLDQLIAPEERASFWPRWHAALREQRAVHWEGKLAEGALHRWLRLQLAPDGHGGWQGVLIDISELKEQAEEARRILDDIPIAIAISDLDDSNPAISFLNAEFIRRFGWHQQELPCLNDWAQRAYPDPAYRKVVISQWLEAVERARHEQGSVAGMEFQVHTAQGEVRDVLFSGRVIGEELLVTLLDVTERRASEQQLIAAQDALARTALEITEAIPVGTYTMVLKPGDQLASFSFMSDRFLELTGLKREEALADPLKAFACVHPDDYDAWVQLNAEVFAKKLPFFGETRVVVNGAVRWITAESVPRELPDGTTVWEGVLIDVTERVEAQQLLMTVLNNIPVAVAIHNLDADDPEISLVNDHLLSSFGYSRRDLKRVSDWHRLAFPNQDDREKAIRSWNGVMHRAMAHKCVVEQGEYQVRCADGQERQLLIRVVILDAMALIAMVDVTELRRSEQQLAAAQDALSRTALEVTAAIPVGTYVLKLDAKGQASFCFLSERWLEMLKLCREDVLADPQLAFNRVHPEDRASFEVRNAEVFRTGEAFFWEGRIEIDQVTRWVSIESKPRNLADGSKIWEGVMIDITERVQAQQRLERILNNIPVAIAIQDLEPNDAKVLFLNDHFIRTLGYTRRELRHVSDWARLAYPDLGYRDDVFRSWNAAMQRAMAQQGNVEQAEYQVRSASGCDLRLLISAVVLNDMALVAMVDVTEHRKAEHQVMQLLKRERDQEEQLRKSIEEKLRVSLAASAVAHEISQPLSAIRINSELALRCLESDQKDVALLRELLEPILDQSQQMDVITDRISMLLRQVHTQRMPLDLIDVIESALLQMQPRMQQIGIKLSCEQPDRPCLVAGDAVQLQLALLNLLRNAVQAIGEMAGRHDGHITIRLRYEENWLELAVADNGPGFPPSFDPLAPLATTKSSGSGIGLYVVQLAVDNHGGSLRIGRSRILGGAEVTMVLPALTSTAPAAQEGARP